ncbi:MAG: ABC-type transport auxiliary lipoprotein family protein [Burkholderiaceae bacterium]
MTVTQTMPQPAFVTSCLRLCAVASLLTLGACSALRPTATPPPAFYSLDSSAPATAHAMPTAPANAPTLVVSTPRAAAGFDSQRIIYQREPYKLEYFAHNEWIDPPALMLGPLLIKAVERSGAFHAVVLSPGSASGELRLDTELVRLQQEFQTRPSRVHFTLRAYLIDERTRRPLGWREFDAEVPAPSDDPYGGVVAANQAVQQVLAQVAAFCVETAKLAPTATP